MDFATDPLIWLAENCANTSVPDPGCPALEPPAGTLPLDPNAYSLYPITLGLTASFSILVFFAIVVRVFTRAYLLKHFYLEDGFIIAASVVLFMFVGLLLAPFRYGFGKHQWNVTVGMLTRILKLTTAAQVIYCLAMLLAKLGILLQIKRIFGGVRVKTYLFWATPVVIAIVTSAYVATMFLLIFACNPIKKAWTPFLEGKCHDNAAGIVSGVVNVVSDFLIILLPIWEVHKLQLSLQKKIGVGAIFGTGLLACAISAIRLAFSIVQTKSEDFTWWLAVVGTSAALEVAVVILCGCFSVFPRFYQFWKAGRKRNPERSGYQYRSVQGPSHGSTQRSDKSKWGSADGSRGYGDISEVRGPGGSVLAV